MIEIKNISKTFDTITALDQVSFSIEDHHVYGIVGTNGAGKSTLLRIVAGILKADHGTVQIDHCDVFEHPEVKQKIAFIPDRLYTFPNARSKDLMEYYGVMYPDFQKEKFLRLCQNFNLDPNRKLSTFSKGMKKQISILLGICANTPYMLCDETFDGLDPVVRQAVKSIFIDELMNRSFTPVIASHNLREMEDICDQVGLLHNGGILFSRDLSDMKSDIHKVQYVSTDKVAEEEMLQQMTVLKKEDRGQLSCITVRGSEEDLLNKISALHPLFYEILPLSLEEIFISETEVIGYDIKDLIL